jgi:hypothetical protein
MTTPPTREDIGKALLRRIGGGMSLALGGAPDLPELRPELARMGLVRPPPAPAGTSAVDPDGDPLAALTAEERAKLEKDPKLKERFLAKVSEAEAAGKAERERVANLEATWAAHDAREAADAAAARTIAERAAARSGK